MPQSNNQNTNQEPVDDIDTSQLTSELDLILTKTGNQLSTRRVSEDEYHEQLKELRERLVLSDNSYKVLERRYLKKKDGQVPEEPFDLFNRVAGNIAQGDAHFGATADEIRATELDFLGLLLNKDFMPNSPCLMNAGREMQQLSACFVLPVEDSISGIFDAIKYQALIHKSGGGTGFSFSRLRSNGSRVKSTQGIASGPVSFMRVFNSATEAIKQGGTRRGANMGILQIDHPDILDFIKIKEDLSEMVNFNISVAITDKFMKAVKEEKPYDLVNPRNNEVVDQLDAKKVFNLIVHHAWLTGDPGIIFIDRINDTNPARHAETIEATNPCGEQPLAPFDSCNLGSINLANFIEDGEVDYKRLAVVTHQSVHFLDNVIEMNNFPIPQIKEKTLKNRRIGLGVMGYADMLIALGIPYNSEEAYDLGKKVMGFIDKEAKLASAELGRQRGNFPAYAGSVYDKDNQPMRNVARTTIAPTGTISMIADCSSGIEPLFAVVFTKTVMDGTALLYIHPQFSKIAKKEGWYSQELMEKIAQEGSIAHIDEIPERVKKIFVTAHDITPREHILTQAAFQKSVDNAISKTVNFSKEATENDVAEAYQMAYDLDCKGVTIFRDGSRDQQVLTTGKTELQGKKTESKTGVGQTVSNGIEPRERGEVMQGATYAMQTAYGKMFVTINNDDQGKPFEVFATIGKNGGFFAAKTEAICRLISLALRSGIMVEEIVKQIKGIRGPSPYWTKGGQILSLPDAIAQVIERHINKTQPKLDLKIDDKPMENTVEVDKLKDNITTMQSVADAGTAPACPDCGSMLELAEGCRTCRSCGYSKCA
ncbi:MAG: vitamin B12-dependent ribonucleotide reductase [Patescibacteria group bacterium]